jgi:hypothetical protein
MQQVGHSRQRKCRDACGTVESRYEPPRSWCLKSPNARIPSPWPHGRMTTPHGPLHAAPAMPSAERVYWQN